VWFLIAVDALAWTMWSFTCGWWHRRTPVARLSGGGPVLRLRPFEARGDWYEHRLHIKRWKDRLPETGARAGGLSKRHLPGRSERDLQRFAAECSRGERTHWSIMAGAPAFGLWNPHDIFLVAAGCGIVGNAPFIAILRYNRARVFSVLQRPFAPLRDRPQPLP
jgi:glycosyl-4,4'-diaponeurosporenoate acyltransferase